MKRALVLGVFSLFVSLSLHGGTVTYGTTYGPQAAGGSGTFTLPQFNSALGILSSVQLTIVGNSAGGSNQIENESPTAGSGTVSIGSNITVTGPAALLVLTQPAQSNTDSVAADSDGGPDYLGDDVLSVTGTNSTDTQSDLLQNPFDDLSAYIGAGTVTFNVASATNSSNSVDFSPSAAYTLPPDFDFTATVLYTFSPPIPEPASAVLLGIMGIGLLCRRR